MIDSTALFKILSIFIVSLISPGPDFMIVSSISLARGRADGVKAAAGTACVIAVYTFISLIGMSALLTRYSWLILAIKVSGGLYLLYLGILLWRNSLTNKTSHSMVAHEKKNAFLSAVLTSLTNPKAIAFFASIFAIALTPNTNISTKIAIEMAIPLATFMWFSCVAIGLSKAKLRACYQRSQHIINRVTGTILAVFGLKLILSIRE